MSSQLCIEEFEFDLQNTTCVSLISHLNDEISHINLNVLGSSKPSHYSLSLWEWLYERSILYIPLGQEFADLIESDDLLRELMEVDFGNRKHASRSYSSRKVYYGHILLSSLAHHLDITFTLTSLLMPQFIWLQSAQDTLHS